MKKKLKTVYSCQNCTYQVPKWIGRCPDCGSWNSFEEESFEKITFLQKPEKQADVIPVAITEVKQSQHTRTRTGLYEFDRALGGGCVEGSLTLIGGEPGIGKSTLLMQIIGSLSQQMPNEKTLYISGEESLNQVADRAKRLKTLSSNLLVYNQTSWQKMKEHIERYGPKFIVIDSIQTTTSANLDSSVGSVSQIKEVTYELMSFIKEKNISCFMIGHINKEGHIAGPKVLEHMVDTVIYFEGEPQGQYRILRVIKNRFGCTDEVGLFEMTDRGIKEVSHPTDYFLQDSKEKSFGRSLCSILEGNRGIFIEVQALVVENKTGSGKKVTQGHDPNRLSMLVAIMEKYLNIPLGLYDVYVNIIGGLNIRGRETDLSVIASMLSSYKKKPIESGTLFLGEVGLTGEIRSIIKPELRLKEMVRLNYKRLITNKNMAQQFNGTSPIEVIGIQNASELNNYI